MGRTLKETRQAMDIHTVYIIYENGKPMGAHGRIAFERKQDAKSIITSRVNSEVRRTTRTYNKNAPEFIAAEEEIRKRYTIVPYRAVGGQNG